MLSKIFMLKPLSLLSINFYYKFTVYILLFSLKEI